MTQPALTLFQVCASAIPTLLIAVAVSLSRGRGFAEDYAEQDRYERIGRLIAVILMGALVVNAEINALLATARGSGTREQAFWVVLGTMLLLINVIYELIFPVAAAESNQWLQLAVVIITIGLATAALLIIIFEFVPFT